MAPNPHSVCLIVLILNCEMRNAKPGCILNRRRFCVRIYCRVRFPAIIVYCFDKKFHRAGIEDSYKLFSINMQIFD